MTLGTVCLRALDPGGTPALWPGLRDSKEREFAERKAGAGWSDLALFFGLGLRHVSIKLRVDRSERSHFHNQNKATQSALSSPGLRLSIITCFLVKPGVFFHVCYLC